MSRFGLESDSIGIRSQIMLKSYSASLNDAMADLMTRKTGRYFGTYGNWELGINTETGEAKLNKVTTVYVNKTDTLVHVHTDSDTIDTTTTHPFYVEGRGFVAAADLQEGDKIYALDGSLVEVKAVEIEKTKGRDIGLQSGGRGEPHILRR